MKEEQALWLTMQEERGRGRRIQELGQHQSTVLAFDLNMPFTVSFQVLYFIGFFIKACTLC